jgi:hypothetical protein
MWPVFVGGGFDHQFHMGIKNDYPGEAKTGRAIPDSRRARRLGCREKPDPAPRSASTREVNTVDGAEP